MPLQRLVEGQHFGICCQRLSADAPEQSQSTQGLDTAASKESTEGEARHKKAAFSVEGLQTSDTLLVLMYLQNIHTAVHCN